MIIATMIAHALHIVINELNKFFERYFNSQPSIHLGNIAEGFVGSGTNIIERDKVYFSVVNIKEEKTLKNLTTHFINDSSRVAYQNQPVFINFLILAASTYSDYAQSLSVLSRVIRFFQFNNVFTQDNVLESSIDTPIIDNCDKLETFKLIFDLYSPSLEEVNHLWGTLGGKQYPFVLYTLRMLELQFKATQKEGGLVEEVVTRYSHID